MSLSASTVLTGDPDPNPADIALTRRLVEVGAMQGIPVLDHVIVTPGDSVSLASLGLLPKPQEVVRVEGDG